VKKRVIIAGTRFGRFYLAGLASPDSEVELAGVLARGSDVAQACARHYGVPLYTQPESVPGDVELACVVVGSGVNGGPGATLAKRLMARGIHVLQEHPVQHTELTECLRESLRYDVTYRVNTHYVNLSPVRRFIDAARRLRELQRPLFVDAVAGFQTACSLFDILGEALGGLRPWRFATPAARPAELAALSADRAPFRTLEGVVAGVPLTLRIQHQLAPREPDNFVHCFHQITIGTEGGHLMLANTHGPVLWCPRPHMPADSIGRVRPEESVAEHLDFASTMALGPAQAPSYREIMSSVWPAGVRCAVDDFIRLMAEPAQRPSRGQRDLAVSRIWSDTMLQLGQLELLEGQAPHIVDPHWLCEAVPGAGEVVSC
jgi:pyochelin biosynthesis protein PchG